MTPQEFIAKWQRANLSERAACQEHFLDLCAMLGQATPAAADPDGEWYTFERGVTKSEGGHGWADVWKKDYFGWEYKGKHKDLVAAYKQLQLYREDLDNPPLLVVCDLDRFEIHTNFTGTAKKVYAFTLAELPEPSNLDVLRKLFNKPEALKPQQTTEDITVDAATRFAKIADGLRARGIEPHAAAHFVMKLMFCMFGEDIGLLPDRIFKTTLEGAKNDPVRLAQRMRSLFKAMAKGGDFGPVEIPYFNGGLFDGDDDVAELTRDEIEQLIAVNAHDWASVEPSIFGTLFERSLDPAKRSQIGAHYTSETDIRTLVEPVVMTPLRREWAAVRERCDDLWTKIKGAAGNKTKSAKPRKEHDQLLRDFVERLSEVTILDPACGSGNFLYVAINLLLDLEKEVIAYAATHGSALLPHVRPTQLAGLEINPYAQQLAQVVIWIGYLQWMHHNGFNAPRDPILEPIESIRCMDAILDLSDPKHPKEPQWPKADYIVGNPPFLGGKLLRTNLGDDIVNAMFSVWGGRVSKEADLCCYWFEMARQAISKNRTQRAGLIATQGIRGGANRRVIEEIKTSGDVFFAVGDRDWVLDGANVHVSIVGFDNGTEKAKTLDGLNVEQINSNLTSNTDVTKAKRLLENRGLSLMGDTKGGKFDIPAAEALRLLHAPNAHGRPNSDVLLPWINGSDVSGVGRDYWLIDFGVDMTLEKAATYEMPFQHVAEIVKPARSTNKREAYKSKWWIHVEPRPALRAALSGLSRFIATVRVSKHRVFRRFSVPTIPDSATFAFVRDDDFFFGMLNSAVHETWARSQATQLRERESGLRYTPETCFETFPFPKPTDAQRSAIAAAAKELDTLRNNWLNPPEWTREEVLEFPGSTDGPWARYVTGANDKGIGTVRYPRTVPKDDECAKRLAKRTLTNLYNERPTWLDLAHKRLDEAVFAAYGWHADLSDDDLLAKLLALNLERAGNESPSETNLLDGDDAADDEESKPKRNPGKAKPTTAKSADSEGSSSVKKRRKPSK